MVRKIVQLIIIGLLLPAADGVCSQDSDSEAWQETNIQTTPTYQRNYFNYPHPLPPDYVYRTERVFSPPSKQSKSSAAGDAAKAGTVPQKAGDGQLARKVHLLSRQLLDNAKEEIADNYVLMVSTFVNLNRLYSTSSLGRYISEQLISDLQGAGIDVIDVRKAPGIMISQGYGEYGLSRDMDELSFVQPVQAMVAGTYTVAEGSIFINARVLRNSDGMVLSAAFLEFAVDPVVRRLLADEGMPAGPGKPLQVRAFNE